MRKRFCAFICAVTMMVPQFNIYVLADGSQAKVSAEVLVVNPKLKLGSKKNVPTKSEFKKINKKVAKGKKAKITSKKIKTEEKLFTTGFKSNFVTVSPVSDFIDYKGNYSFAFNDEKKLYIKRLSDKLKVVKTIKTKMRYKLLGGVVADNLGYYYVAWGNADEKGTGTVTTFAVSKYDYNGNYVGECPVKMTDAFTSTQIPFSAGNCAMTIVDKTLVCSYAKMMFNGKQSNEVVCVNTDTMERVANYYSYTSNSFDQRVLGTNDGKVIFADLGDTDSRGFNITYSEMVGDKLCYNKYVPFHFFGKAGDNYTNALLGGVAETKDGIVFVGASAKSISSSVYSQEPQLFMMLLDSKTGAVKSKGKTRKGTSANKSVKDKGIKWLTNYGKKKGVNLCKVTAIEGDNILVMWETNKNYIYSDSYYMIVTPKGKVVQKPTSLGKHRLNGNEEIVYKDGCIYWVAGNGTGKVTVNKMKLGAVK
ncbi:MAG: hypothetical protein E7254_11385 [Lachnospiraceae bacterium]|nr:hypothetical protein [Lachnospiraceae bacterium]